MKILFCYDGHLKTDSNYKYYSNNLNDEILKLYKQDKENVLTIAMRVDEIENANKNFLEVKNLNYVVELPNIFSVKGLLFNRRKFYKIIKEEVKKNDFIIARLPSKSGDVAIKYAKRYNKKYFIEMVGCVWDSLWNHSFKGKLLAGIRFIQTKKSIKNASYVQYVSNEFLQERYPTNGKTLACSDVELKEIDENNLTERLNKIRNANKNEKVILGTVAAVDVKYKGQQYVIRAINELNKEGYNFEYLLAGGGNNTYLKKMARKYKVEENVKFLGPMQHDEIFRFLKNIDIYIQPSDQEGMCRSIIEAMSMACPCVVSNAGGNPEIIENSCVFKQKKYKEIINILKKLDKNKLLEQAKNNFERAKEFDNKKLKNKREEFFNEIIDKKEKKKRVLHVVNKMSYGGIETFIMNIYKNINKDKIQFDFAVYSNENGDYDNEIRKMGGSIFHFCSRRKSTIKYYNDWNNFLRKNAKKYVAIHVHSSSLTTILPIILSKKYKIKKRIIHAHSTLQQGVIHSILSRINKTIVNFFATDLLACSTEAGKYVFGRNKFELIHNGIELNKFLYCKRLRNKIRKELNISNNEIAYVHVGRFTYAKNHSFLIDIFKEIYIKNKNAKLFLIGTGELFQEIKEKVKKIGIENNVYFLGTKKNINELLQAMDIVIFPSIFEGLPVALIEAQASGLPIYASNGISKEIKITNLVKFLSLNTTALEWANIIQRTKVFKRKNMEKSIIDAGYDIKNTIKKLEKIYGE